MGFRDSRFVKYRENRIATLNLEAWWEEGSRQVCPPPFFFWQTRSEVSFLFDSELLRTLFRECCLNRMLIFKIFMTVGEDLLNNDTLLYTLERKNRDTA